MDSSELFKGVAVVIDDEINDKKANINNILTQIKKKNIPFLTFSSLPSEDIVSNFHNLSFLLLDWRLINGKLTSKDILTGVKIPDTLSESQINENIAFLKKLLSVCFCPVFIFSNEGLDKIIDKLEEAGIYSSTTTNHIFVKSKDDLTGRTKLFKEIDNWVKKNSSIYVLKEWEREYHRTKNQLFIDFQKLSPTWPQIMWKTFEDDGVNKSQQLGQLISGNIQTRMTPFCFSNEILKKKPGSDNQLALRNVLEGERFLENSRLNRDDLAPGDVFFIDRHYYVNVRAACDLFPTDRSDDNGLDAIKLYLIKGDKLTNAGIKKSFNSQYGHFSEIDAQVIIFPIHGGKAIDFRLKELTIMTWSEVKDNRIGRILSPHINKLQQKYSLYIQRQGLPRTPKDAIKS